MQGKVSVYELGERVRRNTLDYLVFQNDFNFL